MAADSDAVLPSVPAARRTPASEGGGPARYRICVVCLGNICRSPMAEVVLRDELDRAGLGKKVAVESAGTGDWHLGSPMDARARAELERRGYDGSRHVARQIDSSWLSDYDLVVVMDHQNLANVRRMAQRNPQITADRIRLMREFDPASAPDAEVPDPYDGGPAEYEETFELVHAAAQGLASALADLLGDETGPGRS